MGNETENDVILDLLALAIRALEEHKDESTLDHIKSRLSEIGLEL